MGREILLELLKKKGYDISEQHSDCGMLIFDPAKQDTGAGGSGCGCAASVLAEYLLPKLENGELCGGTPCKRFGGCGGRALFQR